MKNQMNSRNTPTNQLRLIMNANFNYLLKKHPFNSV